ncbi:hypothetical protein EJ04DRAFT_508696 [Polyplosphaeria fusca]|uniref:Secreted protein n=1 Tax=Polyplosphaeria fusca TaxID=682080 RepID=A0A9P4R9P4_9PLEO|nr:hypothetical protein EJ04DRAFT_508696 [Polyplosphaeria fusca]
MFSFVSSLAKPTTPDILLACILWLIVSCRGEDELLKLPERLRSSNRMLFRSRSRVESSGVANSTMRTDHGRIQPVPHHMACTAQLDVVGVLDRIMLQLVTRRQASFPEQHPQLFWGEGCTSDDVVECFPPPIQHSA